MQKKKLSIIVPAYNEGPTIFRILNKLMQVELINGISKNYFSGEPVSRSDAREVAQAWQPYSTVATWYIWRSLDPLPVEY